MDVLSQSRGLVFHMERLDLCEPPLTLSHLLEAAPLKQSRPASHAQKRRDEAEKLVKEVLQDNPKDMTALKLQGLIALTKKDGLNAVNNFRILTQDQPKNHENWLLLARAHQINKETQLAKEAAKKALDIEPEYPEARTFLYGIYLQNKEYDDLIRLIKDFLRADEKDVANWGSLGDVYLRQGEDQEARKAYQKIIDLEPQNPQGYIKMALLSRKNKQSEAAAQYLETALKQNPNYHPALRLLLALHRPGHEHVLPSLIHCTPPGENRGWRLETGDW